MTRAPLYEAEHEDFRKSARTFFEREVVPHHAQWEQDGIVPRELWLRAGRAGLLCFDVPEAYGGPGIDDFRFNVVLSDEQTRAGASGPGLLGPQRHHRPVPQLARDRGAEAAVAAGLRERRDDHRDRDDRARRRVRPAGSPHHGGRRGRPLRRQRVQDVHQQRHQRRPRHRGGADRPRRRPPGHQPAGGRARDGGLRAGPQPRQDRAARPGHGRALVHRRTRPEAEPARRGGPGLPLPDAEPPPGAADHRRPGGRRDRGRGRDVPRLRQDPGGVRAADRDVPAQPVPRRRDGDRGAGGAGVPRRLRARGTSTAS